MKKIIIIGDWSIGLTAAYELARKGNTEIIIFEKEYQLDGISRTTGQIDIGWHCRGHLHATISH